VNGGKHGYSTRIATLWKKLLVEVAVSDWW
jgi:hypothetical protein